MRVKKNEEEEPEKNLIFLQYRGKATEIFERALRRMNAPCKIKRGSRGAARAAKSLRWSV